MKVIKHGNKHVIHKERVTCDICGCVFEFTQADCETRNKTIDKESNKELDITSLFLGALTSKANYGAIKTFYVTCPECKSKFDLREDIFIDLTEEWKKHDSTKTEK